MFTFSTGDTSYRSWSPSSRWWAPWSAAPARSPLGPSAAHAPWGRLLPACLLLTFYGSADGPRGTAGSSPTLGVVGAHPPACPLPSAPQALTWLLKRRATFTAVGGRYFKKRGLPRPRPGWRARREIWGGGDEGRGGEVIPLELPTNVCVVKIKVTQSSPTFWNPMIYTVHGILQARILEGVGFPFFRGSSQPRYRSQVSHIAVGFFTSWATREAHIR